MTAGPIISALAGIAPGGRRYVWASATMLWTSGSNGVTNGVSRIAAIRSPQGRFGTLLRMHAATCSGAVRR